MEELNSVNGSFDRLWRQRNEEEIHGYTNERRMYYTQQSVKDVQHYLTLVQIAVLLSMLGWASYLQQSTQIALLLGIPLVFIFFRTHGQAYKQIQRHRQPT